MAISLLDHIGPGSIPERFSTAVREFAGMETLDPIETDPDLDLDTLLEDSKRVYRAEPSRLWDPALPDETVDRQWTSGEKAVRDREATDWEVLEDDITIYHTGDTIAYEARATVTDGHDEDTLFYAGELAYDLPEQRAEAYLEADSETITPGEAYEALDGEVAVSQWIFDDPEHPPLYREDAGRDSLQAYLEEIDIEEAELMQYDDGERAVFEGEHPSHGDTRIIASTGRNGIYESSR
jgi:hypothetical protein